MAGEQLNKLQNAVTRTTAAIGLKTSAFVGGAKLKTHISTLNKDIASLMQILGTTVYGQWEKGGGDPQDIPRICAEIKEKYDNINALEAEISSLESREAEVLGQKKQESARPVLINEVYVCPNCESAFDLPIKFCRKCGSKM